MSSRAARKSADQPDLFGEAAAARPDVYVPRPEHVRSGACQALELIRSVGAWTDERAWSRLRLIEKAEYYYGVIADDAEAEEWRARCEAEFARLDAAGPRAPEGERAEYVNYPDRDFAPRWARRPPGR